MSQTYYVRIRGRVHGPMDLSRLQGLAKKGQLSRIHDVSDDGQSWQKASSVPEIFANRMAVATSAAAERVASLRQNRAQTTQREPLSGGAQGNATGADGPPGDDTGSWHYSIDGMQYGPVSKMELSQLIKNRSLKRDDLVWKENMANWGEAGNVADLSRFFHGTRGARGPTSRAGIDHENLADPMRRLAAKIIDRLVVLLAILVSIGIMIGIGFALGMSSAVLGGEEMSDESKTGMGLLSLGALFAWLAAILVPIMTVGVIQVYLLTKHSQSIGKRILKMRIVRIEDDEPAGFGNGFILRSLCNNVIGSLLFFTAGAYFMIDACFIFRDDRRCIHDLIAKTKVVDVV